MHSLSHCSMTSSLCNPRGSFQGSFAVNVSLSHFFFLDLIPCFIPQGWFLDNFYLFLTLIFIGYCVFLRTWRDEAQGGISDALAGWNGNYLREGAIMAPMVLLLHIFPAPSAQPPFLSAIFVEELGWRLGNTGSMASQWLFCFFVFLTLLIQLHLTQPLKV